MYGIQVKFHDNAAAVYNANITMILHNVENEADIFVPAKNSSSYFTFDTIQEAQSFLDKWYGLRKLAPNAPQIRPIPLPPKSCFSIIELRKEL
jgi:hypothetical protein